MTVTVSSHSVHFTEKVVEALRDQLVDIQGDGGIYKGVITSQRAGRIALRLHGVDPREVAGEPGLREEPKPLVHAQEECPAAHRYNHRVRHPCSSKTSKARVMQPSMNKGFQRCPA
jgi:hypothetical protein